MRTMVIAPHPDDEILGVGGTLLRRKAEGFQVALVIITNISIESGWNAAQVQKRASEIEMVRKMVGFDKIYNLCLCPAQLDKLPISEIINRLSEVFKAFEPEEIFVSHGNDVHSDHRIVFDAVSACCKWFRYPSIRRILAYETLSETDFSLNTISSFRPNYFVNIAEYLDRKLEVMSVYSSEISAFPFPRSKEAIHALASSPCVRIVVTSS